MKKSIKGLFIWFIVTLFVVYAFFLNTAGAVFGDTIKNYMHLTDMGAAFAVGSFVLGFACMQIPGGYLLDRFPIRIIVSSGLFLLALGNLTLSYSSSLSLFALSNFVQGLGASFAFIAVGKLIGEWFAPKMFPILFGLTQTISCLLSAIIHYYLVQALETVSWQSIYQEFSIFGFVLLAFTAFFVKSPPSAKAKQTISFGKSMGLVLKNKQIWLCSLAAATSFGVLAAYASFWYMPVEKFFAVSVKDALVISGMIFVGIGIGTPFLGWLSNKVKSRRLIIHMSVVLGAIFLLMGLYLPHFDINTYIPIEIVSFGIGFLLSGSMLYYTSISEISSPNTRAVALGLINTSVFVFNTVLLFIPQFFITKQSKTYFTYLWVLPACLLVSIFLAYFVKETFPKTSK
ncbi:MAG: MFS transporter [Chlamydiota bacterium]